MTKPLYIPCRYSGLSYQRLCIASVPFYPFLRSRTFATKKSPGFGASTPPSAGPRAYQPKSQGPKNTSDTKSRGKERQQSEKASNEESKQAKPSRKFPIGPGKLITLSILAYIGYRVYTWQTDPHRSRILIPKSFTPFILDLREKVSSTSSILNLRSVPKGQNTDFVDEAWKTGVWSVQVMQPELQIARSYTPLPPAEDAEPEQLRLLVRKEPEGEVSSFLHRITRGTLVHCRGPQIEYELPQDVDEVLFLAGGTGIAPALQIAHTLYNHRASSLESAPNMHILWANRRREDTFSVLDPESPDQIQNPFVQELESLKTKRGGIFKIDYFVDDDSSYITESLLREKMMGPEHVPNRSESDPSTTKKLVFVSGPEGFITFYAGPKFMKEGREIQGPLGGLLRKIEPLGWEVWKL